MARNDAEADDGHMRAALALAARRLGETWPNPAVGCVIVSADGRVVGRGATAPGGRPHAETIALAMAGAAARGASVYVTLEPCSHVGHTPPCTTALIEAGVGRVVIGLRDPDPRVNGAGIAALAAAGIAVSEGVLRDEAADLLAGFASRIGRGRPLVTLKLATTLDGRIATRSGESQWITGEPARRAAHALRGRHDAVMVGIGTLLADDPRLTCRLPGYRARPLVRIIADSHLRTRLTASVVSTIDLAPVWFLVHDRADAARRRVFADLGARLFPLPRAETGIDLAAGLQALGQAGITRLLVEGGAQLAAALLRDDLVDRLAWFHAPSVMGGDGWPAAQGFGAATLAALPRFSRRRVTLLGEDVLSEFTRAA